VPNIILGRFGRDFACFKTASRFSHFKGLKKIKSVFWTSVISTWLRHNSIPQITTVPNACLWNNPNVTYQNSVIFFENWALSGITYVGDILMNQGIKDFPAVRNIVQPTPGLYLEYIVVRSAIDHYLRINNNYTDDITQNNNDKLLFNNKPITKAKDFREHITEEKYVVPISVNFWQNKFNVEIEPTHWNIAINVTNESRLRELHWKILHNIYPTNIILHKIGIEANDRCPFCPTEIDYIEHFFFKCKKVLVLWKYVEDIIFKKYKMRMKLSSTEILCGYTERISLERYKYLNLLFLVAKMCVSKFRYGTPIDITIMFEKELLLRKIPF